jgi:hypothetical protein
MRAKRAWIEHGPHAVEGIRVLLLFFAFHETMTTLHETMESSRFLKILICAQVEAFEVLKVNS